MNTRSLAAALACLMVAPTLTSAAEASLQLELSGAAGNFERQVMQYDCAAEAPTQVTYINAAPNFLALVPVPDEEAPLVFASVISASGVRYMSGQWVWWTKGAEASLYDATLGDDAAPVLTCTELNNTP